MSAVKQVSGRTHADRQFVDTFPRREAGGPAWNFVLVQAAPRGEDSSSSGGLQKT